MDRFPLSQPNALPKPLYTFDPEDDRAGPFGLPVPPDFAPQPIAPAFPRAQLLSYWNCLTSASSSLVVAGWRQIDVPCPTVLYMVEPVGSVGLPSVEYYELYATPQQRGPFNLLPTMRGPGTRLFLPSAGRWYVQVLCNVAVTTRFLVIDASNPAIADFYMRKDAVNASSGISSWGTIVIAAATDTLVLDISSKPDVVRVEIQNTGANVAFINTGAAASATVGESLAAGASTVYVGARFAPATMHVYSPAGTTIRMLYNY